MEFPKVCSRCGGSSLEAGSLGDQNSVAIYPARYHGFFTRSAKISAQVCMDCGCVEMTGDVEKIKELLKGQ